MRDNAAHTEISATAKRVSTHGDVVTHFFQFLLVFALVFALPMFVAIDPVIALQLMSAVLITVGPLSSAVSSIPDFGRLRSALINLDRLEREMHDTGEPSITNNTAPLAPFASIELRAIEFTFRDRDGHAGFQLGPIDFSIRGGEVVFVAGGNGSGKTVLLRVLTGLYRHDQGTIHYNGKPLLDTERDAYREQFATVFSDYFLFRELIGMASIDAGRVASLLEQLDLGDKVTFAGGAFSTIDLSAGQRKLLAYVVAMLDDKPVLILDEFGAEQDPPHRHHFYRKLLPTLRASGKAVIVVSHDDAYFDAADRIIKMDFGRIVEETINVPENRQARSR